MLKAIVLLGSLLLPSSCIIALDGSDYDDVRDDLVSTARSPKAIGQENRSKLSDLEPGMTVEAMHEVMDVASSKKISNPYRHESFPVASGQRAEVFFYYTETIEPDGTISEGELTPVWFLDNSLVGWGRSGFDLWRVNAQSASAER